MLFLPEFVRFYLKSNRKNCFLKLSVVWNIFKIILYSNIKGEKIMTFIKWMDDAPLWLKIVFALPFIAVVWAVYRIVKGALKGSVPILVGGILWILLGWSLLWVVDLVSVILYQKPKVLA